MLIVVRTVDGVASIWQLPLEGDGAPTRVHDSRFREGDARLSPDGRWLAYASFETGRSELYVESYPGGERRWQVSTAGAGFPLWSGDSSELFFADQTRLMAVAMLTAQDPPFREPTLLFEIDFFRRSPVFSGDVAPSGDRFLMIELPSSPPPTGFQVVLNWFEELQQKVPPGR